MKAEGVRGSGTGRDPHGSLGGPLVRDRDDPLAEVVDRPGRETDRERGEVPVGLSP